MTHYLISTRVVSVTEHFVKNHISGAGADATFKSISIGYFAIFEGSHEAIFLGDEKPGLVAGDEVEILIRKKDAK